MITLKEVYENGNAEIGQRFITKRRVWEVVSGQYPHDLMIKFHRPTFELTKVYDDGSACELAYEKLDGTEEGLIIVPYCGAGEIRELGVRTFLAMDDLFLLKGRAKIARPSKEVLRVVV